MRFLANENFPLVAVEALRRAGHDTAWIREVAPGSADDAVLERALRDGRLLLTFDKDFGALVFRRGAMASPCGLAAGRPCAPHRGHAPVPLGLGGSVQRRGGRPRSHATASRIAPPLTLAGLFGALVDDLRR